MSNNNNISMVEAKLPPGFRFHPRDEELICDYLVKKVIYSDSSLMMEVDLNKCEPWDIPETACVGGKEWYFYTQRDRKYATGLRTNRATACGYWKATGKDRTIQRKGSLVGMRKTLVFYQGRAPKGSKTDWVMHEFRLDGPLLPPNLSSLKEDWVLCRVFYKKREVGAKPSMGSCYGDDTGSSTLPALTDSYITFDQTQSNIDEYEQVPCFSIFTPNQTNLTFSQIEEPNIPTCSFEGGLPHLDTSDQKVLKAILNQLAKMETNASPTPSFGEGTTSETYFSPPPPFSTTWNHY